MCKFSYNMTTFSVFCINLRIINFLFLYFVKSDDYRGMVQNSTTKFSKLLPGLFFDLNS